MSHQPSKSDEIEAIVENIASVCDEVEFLHGVPVKLPAQTKALLRGKIREALRAKDAETKKAVEEVFKDLHKVVFLFAGDRAIEGKSTSEEIFMFHELLKKFEEYADEKGIDIDTPPEVTN